MILVFHILVALSSIAYSTYLFFKPSQSGLRNTYGLVGLTFVTGTYVAVVSGAHILETCMSGLFYIGAVSVGIVMARHKLATAKRRVQ